MALLTTPYRIALANLAYPTSPEDSISRAEAAVAEAAARGARIVCFPECYVPGYRTASRRLPPPDAAFLERARTRMGKTAADHGIAVILGSERIVGRELRATAVVFAENGRISGFQDKVQLDPSEETTYMPGTTRSVFTSGPLTFGIAICHEGWRYPETVRWAVRRGAQVVFHPQHHEAEPNSYRPTTYADPANTFHEKATLCRAAENTCYFATVNYSSEGSPTTSAVIGPDGAVVRFQPYGLDGLLVVDVDLLAATGILAQRYREVPE